MSEVTEKNVRDAADVVHLRYAAEVLGRRLAPRTFWGRVMQNAIIKTLCRLADRITEGKL